MSESNALFQLGSDLNRDSSKTQAEVLEFPVHAVAESAVERCTPSDDPTDFFPWFAVPEEADAYLKQLAA